MAVATSLICDRMQKRGHIFANYSTTSLHDSAFVEVSVTKYYQVMDPKLTIRQVR